MLPRVHTQQYVNVGSAVGDFAFLPREERGAAERAGGHHGILVLLLPPVMRAWQRRAGEVGRQDGELVFHQVGVAVLVADEPDEAGAEHGVGGRDKGVSEGFGGGEGVADSGCEEGRHFARAGGDGGEELVIGPGHAGVVEEGGGLGLTRVGDDDVFRGGIFE